MFLMEGEWFEIPEATCLPGDFLPVSCLSSLLDSRTVNPVAKRPSSVMKPSPAFGEFQPDGTPPGAALTGLAAALGFACESESLRPQLRSGC